MASSNSEECLTLSKQMTVNCWKFLFKTCLYYAPEDCLKNMLYVVDRFYKRPLSNPPTANSHMASDGVNKQATTGNQFCDSQNVM